MKRVLFVAVGLVLAMAGTASAQATVVRGQGRAQTAPPARAAFVDANGDGVCDTFQSGTPQGKAYGRGRGTGTHVGPQDGTGYGAAQGAGGGTGAQRGRRGRP
ncbi:MAG: hypothetical protein NTW72_10115 [Gemmatimonadetes bacterium]|nr:hypothetical protein [Gemmatimonadota bacterium]